MTQRNSKHNHRSSGHGDRVRTHSKRRWGSDRGFSMMEMLGAIAIAGIIAGAAIIAVPRFIGRANNSKAIAALNTAIAEAQEIYSRPLGTGETNFANTAIAGAQNTAALTTAAVTKLNAADTNLTYYSIADGSGDGILLATGVAKAVAAEDREASADKIRAHGDNSIWAVVNVSEAWGANTTVRPAQAIRLGTAASNGGTFCAIVVADTTTGWGVGRGFMGVDEEDSNTDAHGWADCGLFVGAATRDVWSPAELPGSAEEPGDRPTVASLVGTIVAGAAP